MQGKSFFVVERARRSLLLVSSAIAPLIFISARASGDTIAFGQDFGNALNYGILYEGNGGKTLSFNNSIENGNIGIGGTGGFQGNGPGSITGTIQFAAASSGQFSNSGVTLSPSSNNPKYSVADVATSLTDANLASQTLGKEAGKSVTISGASGVTVNTGTVDTYGNYVFAVTPNNFANGTFTITGTAGQYAVFNIDSAVALDGSIALAGGITWDHVLFNFTPDPTNLATYNSDYASLSGGPTMTINTNDAATTGIFLDPTGNFQVNSTGDHSGTTVATISGSIIGGDTQNSSFVSGADLTLPPPSGGGGQGQSVPLPASVLGGMALLGGLLAARKWKSLGRAVPA